MPWKNKEQIKGIGRAGVDKALQDLKKLEEVMQMGWDGWEEKVWRAEEIGVHRPQSGSKPGLCEESWRPGGAGVK